MKQSKSHLASASDTGRVRANNEDAVAYKIIAPHNAVVCVVADGVGGYHGGEIASELAVTSVLHYLEESLSKLKQDELDTETPLRLLVDAIETANQTVLYEQASNDTLSKMATTLVVLLHLNKHIYIAHAGDSRCYKWFDNQLTQLTKDHTLAQQMLDDGQIEAEFFDLSPYHHVLNNGLGLQNKMHVETHKLTPQKGQVFLLCSDGLSDCLKSANISTVLAEKKSIQITANTLVERANQAGGIDNISLVLYQL